MPALTDRPSRKIATGAPVVVAISLALAAVASLAWGYGLALVGLETGATVTVVALLVAGRKRWAARVARFAALRRERRIA